jgi:arylsulfatase A-like enzyme
MHTRARVVAALALLPIVALLVAQPAAGRETTGGPIPVPAAAEDTQQPNIIFIMTDDQAVEDMIWMPKTQALIGDQGVTYANSWTSLSWCCPSRATMKTGQHAHNNGVFNNALPAGGFNRFQHQTALPVWLQNAGYHTVHIGKAMNDTKRNIPDGWDDWRSTVGGDHRMYKWKVNDNGRVRSYGTGVNNFQGDVYAGMAVDVIENHDTSQPLFMHYTLSAPHVGQGQLPEPPRRHKNTVDDPIPQPPGFEVPADMTFAQLEKEYQRRAESLKGADDQVERLMTALSEKGILDNTVVMFTSDNGFTMGHHGDRGKSIYWQEAMRVPLMIRGPGFPAGTITNVPVQNIDLAPTIADLANATPLITVDGVSLLGEVPSNRGLLIESKRDEINTPLWEGIVTERFIYVDRIASTRDLIWDLALDPYQINDEFGNPAYEPLIDELHAILDGVRACAGDDCMFTVDNRALAALLDDDPDLTPPDVAWVSPDDQSSVAGLITFGVSATDDREMGRVEFSVDGNMVGIDDDVSDTDFEFELDTSPFLDGLYTIQATAVDAYGNTSTSAISLRFENGNVPDTEDPTISWLSPADGSSVSGAIVASATATDNVSVDRVEFSVDGAVVGVAREATDSVFSIEYLTTNELDGDYVFAATAFDTAGNSSTSANITLSFDNGNVANTVTFPARTSREATLSVTPGVDSLQVEWSEVANALRYQVRYKKTGRTWIWIPAFSDLANPTYETVIADLGPGTYRVQVRTYVAGAWRTWNGGSVSIE